MAKDSRKWLVIFWRGHLPELKKNIRRYHLNDRRLQSLFTALLVFMRDHFCNWTDRNCISALQSLSTAETEPWNPFAIMSLGWNTSQNMCNCLGFASPRFITTLFKTFSLYSFCSGAVFLVLGQSWGGYSNQVISRCDSHPEVPVWALEREREREREREIFVAFPE
jgi:hypothetical protein